MLTGKEILKKGLAIGITGGIACGKNEVGSILYGLGVWILDTDRVAHNLLESNQQIVDKVVSLLGSEMVDSHGCIDRKVLASIVFSDTEKLDALNDIMHPAIIDITWQWVQERKRDFQPCAVLIPLLYEIGMIDKWDAVLCIASSRDTMLSRMMSRGWSEADAVNRMNSQMPIEEKIARADYTIWNEGTLKDLKCQVTEFWNSFTQQ